MDDLLNTLEEGLEEGRGGNVCKIVYRGDRFQGGEAGEMGRRRGEWGSSTERLGVI